MSVNHKIELISTKQTLPLRQKVLKPFLPADECVNPGDDLPTTYHFGLFYSGKLIAVATFLLEPHPNFSAGFPYRLRGMATEEKYRGQGFGQLLLRYGIEFLREKRCDFVWCNARIKAFPFYEKLSFKFHGPLFDIKDIGPHKVMYKHIIPR